MLNTKNIKERRKRKKGEEKGREVWREGEGECVCVRERTPRVKSVAIINVF